MEDLKAKKTAVEAKGRRSNGIFFNDGTFSVSINNGLPTVTIVDENGDYINAVDKNIPITDDAIYGYPAGIMEIDENTLDIIVDTIKYITSEENNVRSLKDVAAWITGFKDKNKCKAYMNVFVVYFGVFTGMFLPR